MTASPGTDTDTEEVARQPEPEATETGSVVVAYGERRVTVVGPLPLPAILAQYEQVCSGAADRIISMAERQSAHRQQLENAVISANCDSQRRGPVFGFILASMVIVIGGLLVWNDKDLAGLAALLGALAAIVIPFLVSKRRQQSELEEKRFQETAKGIREQEGDEGAAGAR